MRAHEVLFGEGRRGAALGDRQDLRGHSRSRAGDGQPRHRQRRTHYDHKRHADFSRQFERQCREQIASPPKTQLDELTDKIETEAKFLAQHSDSAKAILHICKHFDREIKRKTNNVLDLKIGLAGGLIAVTLLEVGATAATPISLTLGVFMLNHFLEPQQRQQLVEHIKSAPPPSAPVVVKTKVTS